MIRKQVLFPLTSLILAFAFFLLGAGKGRYLDLIDLNSLVEFLRIIKTKELQDEVETKLVLIL